MIAKITETKEEPIAGTTQTHWDVVEVWEAQAHTDDADPNILVELGTDVLMDDWLGMNTIDEETETEIFWDAKSCQEDEDINCQSDIEEEQFWDSLASSDGNIDTQIKVEKEMGHNDKTGRVVHIQTEPNEDDSVQKGYNIKEAWDDIYKDEVLDSKTDSKKVDWNLISSNEDIIGVDDEKKNNNDKSHIMMFEQARDSKASFLIMLMHSANNKVK